MAQAAGDGWNEGYALGIRAAIAGVKGNLREAQQLAKVLDRGDAPHRPGMGHRAGAARPG